MGYAEAARGSCTSIPRASAWEIQGTRTARSRSGGACGPISARRVPFPTTRTPRRTSASRRRPPPRPSPASRTRGRWSRGLLEDPAVSVLLEVAREVRIPALYDLPVDEDVDDVRYDVVEQTLVVRDDEHRPLRASHRVDAVRHEPQGVDVESGVGLVEDAEFRLEDRHLEHLVLLFLAAREAFVQAALHERLVEAEELRLVLDEGYEVHRVDLVLAAVLPDRVQGGLQEVGVAHARDLDGILECHEHAFAGTVLRLHREQVLPFEAGRAPRDLVRHTAGQDLSQRRLSATVRAHDRVDLARLDRQVDSFQDLLAGHLHVQTLDLEHRHLLPGAGRAQPTVPSRARLTPISFWASTANSIGSFRKTCLQKPLTIMFVASSGVMPRVWQ